MARKKPNYHHGDLLAQIEHIAWDKVRENGAENLSLRSCARDAGVDPAAVYRHFTSKESLLAHLANRAFVDLAKAMESAQEHHVENNPKEALVQIGLAYINYAVSEPHVFKMMFDVAGRLTPVTPSEPSKPGQTAYQLLVSGIERLEPTTPVEVHVFTLWSMVHGFSDLVNTGLGPDRQQFEQISRALCETAVATIF